MALTKYYRDTKPWVLYGEQIEIVEDNEHLGQVISGHNQTQKNIDKRIIKGRQSLFGLLGSTYQYKCKMSPAVKMHIYRTLTYLSDNGVWSFNLSSEKQ